MFYDRRARFWLIGALVALVSLLPHTAAARPILELDFDCNQPVFHHIRWGDTVWGLAQQYGVSQNAIVAANGLGDGNLIYGGHELLIPTCGTTSSAAPPAPVAPATTTAPATATSLTARTLVIARGDTLWSFAQRFGVSESAIAQANGITNPSRIYAGLQLTIPTTPPAAPAAPVAPVAPVAVVAPVGPQVVTAQSLVGPAGASVITEAAPPQPVLPAASAGGKRIEVNLSTQTIYAFDGSQLILQSGVSTGRPGWETPPGHFAIYEKRPIQTMTGTVSSTSWYVPNVPNVMYFFGGDALHGTYWHNQFGTGARLSHGCVNLPLNVAATLYAWAPVGTPVWVHW